MSKKIEFIESLKSRTMKLSIAIIKFCDTLKKCKAESIISYQIIKSSTSVAANYSAACRARSKAEFFSKMCIVVEEADETEHWLELILEAELYTDRRKLGFILEEAKEICRIMTKTKDTLYRKKSV